MAGGAFDDLTKRLVERRAGGRCEICGTAGEQWHYHHRRPRGMGGTSREDTAGAANALLIHPRCHDRIEKNRVTGYENGWLVPQQEDPQTTPVKLWDGWALLHWDGTLSPASPAAWAGGSVGKPASRSSQ